MILPDFKAFPRTGRIIGVDWGAARIGVAISDEGWDFVFVRPTIENRAWSSVGTVAVANFAHDEKAVGIVVGLPIRGDGTESTTTMAVRRFASELATHTDLPIVFINENLTSAAATENLAGVKRGKLKEKLDSEAARVILENAIGMIKRNS